MGDPIRVLHVDDEPDFLDLVATMLEDEIDRATVERATTASEALDLLERRVDCVVSDYEMPGMDGIDLLVAVRDRHPDLPFVLFTGTGSEDVASTAAAHGATDCLSKGAGSEQYALLADRLTEAVRKQGIHSTVSTPS